MPSGSPNGSFPRPVRGGWRADECDLVLYVGYLSVSAVRALCIHTLQIRMVGSDESEMIFNLRNGLSEYFLSKV